LRLTNNEECLGENNIRPPIGPTTRVTFLGREEDY